MKINNEKTEPYICPYCGEEIAVGERVFAPDDMQFICGDCFADYIGDLTPVELCIHFNIASREVGE